MKAHRPWDIARERFIKALDLSEQGLTHAAIAERMGVKTNHVSTMVKRGRELKLREEDLARRKARA